MKEAILKVKNLDVDLDNERILSNLSFKVKKGDVFIILGPNGAGKTVLLKTLLGLLSYEGKIEWKKGIKMSYVPQRLPFIKDIPMSVLEFFELKGADENEAGRFLKAVGLEEKDLLDRRIGDLSSGQFQRILIGWALVGNPQVLIFVEPFSGIDVSGIEPIYSLLEQLAKKGLTILLVSHELNIVYRFATSVLCLNKETLCQGSPKEILNPKNLSKLYKGQVKFYSHSHD